MPLAFPVGAHIGAVFHVNTCVLDAFAEELFGIAQARLAGHDGHCACSGLRELRSACADFDHASHQDGAAAEQVFFDVDSGLYRQRANIARAGSLRGIDGVTQ